MEKVEWIKGMADSVFNSYEMGISNDEFEFLISISQSPEEKELYAMLYNYFLKKKSEEVIKNGIF